MGNESLCAQMAGRAVEARERFSEAKFLRNWDHLFAVIGLH
jgi:hypothetical protein